MEDGQQDDGAVMVSVPKAMLRQIGRVANWSHAFASTLEGERKDHVASEAAAVVRWVEEQLGIE